MICPKLICQRDFFLRPAFFRLLAPLFAVAALSACGGDSSDPVIPQSGEAEFSMTDAPADDVAAVHLTIDRVQLKQSGGATVDIQLEEPVVFEDLLALQGSSSALLLPERSYPAGGYEWIRLYVVGGGDDSYVVTDQGGQVDLFVPGQQVPGTSRFVQLVSGFTIAAGGSVDYTIDVDLRKALTKPQGKDYYLLRPAMRIVDNSNTGSISGTVDAALLDDPSCSNDLVADEGNAVYLFDGEGTGDVVVDSNGEAVTETTPVSVALVTQNTISGEYEYELGFVAAGEYTVALTCQALDDAPETDDEISFLQQAAVSFDAGADATQDFTATAP
ncbi:MAG: DUF4382 domain-containing protein [Alcanivoracaceae bacterium]